jgi:hypothetical protein
MKRPWIGRKDFFNSHGTRRINGRRGLEKAWGRGVFGCFFLCDSFLEREGEGWRVLVDGGKGDNGLNVWGTSKNKSK